MQSNPHLAIGWHVPTWGHSDKPALDALAAVLSAGRSSRLYAALVKEQQIAAFVVCMNGYPGERYPGLFVVYAEPRSPHGPEACEAAIYREMDRVMADGISQRALDKAVNQYESGRFLGLGDNTDIATVLANAQAALGDWRLPFRRVDDLRALGIEDVQRVAREYLVPHRRSVMTVLPSEGGGR